MATVLQDQFELDYRTIEETAKELYVRALKILPPQVKRGFERLQREETDGTAKTILGTMVENIAVAERTRNLLCQDTGIPIYNVTIGRDVRLDGVALKAALRRGAERATREPGEAVDDEGPEPAVRAPPQRRAPVEEDPGRHR